MTILEHIIAFSCLIVSVSSITIQIYVRESYDKLRDIADFFEHIKLELKKEEEN